MPITYQNTTFPDYNTPIPSTSKDKKMMVLVRHRGVVRLVHFGQRGYAHNYSPEAKANYLARSAGIRDKDGNLTKDDPFSPNYWARKVLWPDGPADGKADSTGTKEASLDEDAGLPPDEDLVEDNLEGPGVVVPELDDDDYAGDWGL